MLYGFCESVSFLIPVLLYSWWRHQIETFSALLVLCAGNSPGPGEFSAQRPVTLSFEVVFDLRLNKRLGKQSRRRWSETPLCSLWRHCNVQPRCICAPCKQDFLYWFLDTDCICIKAPCKYFEQQNDVYRAILVCGVKITKDRLKVRYTCCFK